VLNRNGVKKGDRVTIYLPMIPEAAYAMLACARIGAMHSIVFGGFSPDSLAGRIERLRTRSSSSPRTKACAAAQGAAQGQCRPRGAKRCAAVDHVIVVRRTGGRSPWRPAATSGITAAPHGLRRLPPRR
jgi:acetyl-CoA synthetase